MKTNLQDEKESWKKCTVGWEEIERENAKKDCGVKKKYVGELEGKYQESVYFDQGFQDEFLMKENSGKEQDVKWGRDQGEKTKQE